MPSPTVYLNGSLVTADDARVSAQDRGMAFSDGVYEVIRYAHGQAFDLQSHRARLTRSLGETRLAHAMDGHDLQAVSDELVARNACPDAKLYWQITRGDAWRNHPIPADVTPTVFASATPIPPVEPDAPAPAARCVLADDVRWSRCDIKSLMLLPNVLALAEAREAGADDAIFVRDGIVTESTSRNVLIAAGGELLTHPADGHILHGTTRRLVIDLARELGITVHETAFDAEALRAADEVMLCSTTSDVLPVVAVDGRPIAAGVPGPMALRLRRALQQRIVDQCPPS